MNALENLKSRMEKNRRAKEKKIPTLSDKSLQTGKDMENILNTVCATATDIKLPNHINIYARERYIPLTKALSFTLDEKAINHNVSTQEMIDAGISYKDCQNDYLAIFFEPEEKHIFVDKEPVSSEPMNNLRVCKYMGLFQFQEKACKLRFFRLTDELDCKGEDQELNDKAAVLNSLWNIEPYHLKMRPDFIELYLRGEDFEPEVNTVGDYGIPPDSFIIEMLLRLIKALLNILYSLNQNKNRYCRLTYKANVRNLQSMLHSVIMPISILQMMPNEMEIPNQLELKQQVKPKPKPKPKRRRN